MAHILQELIDELIQNNELIVISEEVDPDLLMSAIHLEVYKNQGPAILFENVKGSKYRAVCNLFGTVKRSHFIFRKQWATVQKAIELRNQPFVALKKPFNYLPTLLAAKNSLPKKVKWNPSLFDTIQIQDLPQIKHWPMDGGAFITLPQVYSEHPDEKGLMRANVGMYRIQLSGNEYITNEEIGLHYQIHRGIGIHHTAAARKGVPLKVSIFVGGHPAHTLSAVMPLPEGLSEWVFAGMLAGRRFRYAYDENGHCVSMDADFVITGEINPNDVKPEGPFGDHLGYYSLKHPFPVMKVKKVYARKNAIWPFTTVGRPPQEDTSFGHVIHELTGEAIPKELPGIKAVHAVDKAGVHPLLFAIGSERYTPYQSENEKPAELLTQAHHVLGTNQLSLAKYLFITGQSNYDKEHSISPDIHQEEAFIKHCLERVDFERDLHFTTYTTIDTLDYTGQKLNEGSKVVIAAYGAPKRVLGKELTGKWKEVGAVIVSDGIVAISGNAFTNHDTAKKEINAIKEQLSLISSDERKAFPLIIVCDDAGFLENNYDNFLWVTFTRSNPATDIYGMDEKIENKHWSCKDNLIIDARMKPYMPPVLEMPEEIMKHAREILSNYLK